MTDQSHGEDVSDWGLRGCRVGGLVTNVWRAIGMVALLALPQVALGSGDETAQQPTPRADAGAAAADTKPPRPPTERQPGEHPLVPVLRLAEEMKANIDKNVRDYTAKLTKRGRIDGELAEPETLFVKIRHAQARDGKVAVPFSVYIRFISPTAIKGREVLYVAGRNDGKMLVQESPNQLLGKMFNTTAIDPNGMLAMRGNRYPITEIGIKILMQRLIEVARLDVKRGECTVTYYEGAKVNDRRCRCLQVVHPVRRPYFRYHRARIFVDDELNLPIRYASYDWPSRPGDEPPLLEEYSYLDLRLNVGLTDRDFEQTNPEYNFK